MNKNTTTTAADKALNALRTAKTNRALFAALRRVGALNLAEWRKNESAR